MAEKQIASLNRRKRWLSIQSDTLRYHLKRECNAADETMAGFERGYSFARAGLLLWSAASAFRRRSPSAFLRLLRGMG